MEKLIVSLPYIMVGAYVISWLIFTIAPFNPQKKGANSTVNKIKSAYTALSALTFGLFAIMLFTVFIMDFSMKTNITIAAASLIILVSSVVLRLKTTHHGVASFIFNSGILIGIASAISLLVKHALNGGF
jgi:hypothetical protein